MSNCKDCNNMTETVIVEKDGFRKPFGRIQWEHLKGKKDNYDGWREVDPSAPIEIRRPLDKPVEVSKAIGAAEAEARQKMQPSKPFTPDAPQTKTESADTTVTPSPSGMFDGVNEVPVSDKKETPSATPTQDNSKKSNPKNP